MPRPAILNDAADYGLAWSGVVGVTPSTKNSNRVSVNKTFHAFVECYEQSKHDSQMKSYRTSRGRDYRTAQGTQVVPANDNATNPVAYYRSHGAVAAGIVAREMHKRWQANTTNNTVFVRGAATPLAVQAEQQEDGYYYDVTMWYDGGEIYVAFHCYPPKR